MPDPPGPECRRGASSPLETHGHPLELLEALWREYGDLLRWRSSFGASYLFNRPEHIQHLLHSPKYQRTGVLKIALGESSLSADGDFWRRERRVVQPAFQNHRIEGFTALMTDETERLAASWEENVATRLPLDISKEMMRLTLIIVVKALFSADISGDVQAISDALTIVINDLGPLTASLFSVPVRFDPARNRRLGGALATLDRIVYRIIEERRRSNDAGGRDLLSLLLSARDEETGEALSDLRLRDEAVTMMVAGHETTATLLGWAFYRLSQHPEVEERFHREVDRVLERRVPTLRDVSSLTYTRWVIEETLRLYPPVWTIARKVLADDEVGGYHIAESSAAFISPYLIHRHPELWHSPGNFEPERFSPERSESRPRYAYIPFGLGPHMCLGKHFAMLEAVLALATIGRRLRPRLAEGHPVELEPLITLRARHGLMMTLERR